MVHTFDRQTDGQMSIARCDLTKLDEHKNTYRYVPIVLYMHLTVAFLVPFYALSRLKQNRFGGVLRAA